MVIEFTRGATFSHQDTTALWSMVAYHHTCHILVWLLFIHTSRRLRISLIHTIIRHGIVWLNGRHHSHAIIVTTVVWYDDT